MAPKNKFTRDEMVEAALCVVRAKDEQVGFFMGICKNNGSVLMCPRKERSVNREL